MLKNNLRFKTEIVKPQEVVLKPIDILCIDKMQYNVY